MSAEDRIIRSVLNWVEHVVAGLNLCPFAKHELLARRIHVEVSNATATEDILVDLEAELQRLIDDHAVETTLLVLPDALQDFTAFNQFLDLAEGLVEAMGLTGVFQLAHFHPKYQFADTAPGDAENFTNRSPYPILHLLREESLDRVLQTTEHAEQIPARNIELMNRLGVEEMQRRLDRCSEVGEE